MDAVTEGLDAQAVVSFNSQTPEEKAILWTCGKYRYCYGSAEVF